SERSCVARRCAACSWCIECADGSRFGGDWPDGREARIRIADRGAFFHGWSALVCFMSGQLAGARSQCKKLCVDQEHTCWASAAGVLAFAEGRSAVCGEFLE